METDCKMCFLVFFFLTEKEKMKKLMNRTLTMKKIVLKMIQKSNFNF